MRSLWKRRRETKLWDPCMLHSYRGFETGNGIHPPSDMLCNTALWNHRSRHLKPHMGLTINIYSSTIGQNTQEAWAERMGSFYFGARVSATRICFISIWEYSLRPLTIGVDITIKASLRMFLRDRILGEVYRLANSRHPYIAVRRADYTTTSCPTYSLRKCCL